MAKFSEDKRLEQVNQERRRREMAEYKNEVEQIIQERKALYEQAVESELAQRRILQEEMEYKLSVVEAERQRLLQEYAKDLKEYLPKGVFRTEQDYERVFERKPERSAGGTGSNGSGGGGGSSMYHQQPAAMSAQNAQNNRVSSIKFR